MPALGIFTPERIVLAHRAHRLRIAVLTCLLAAGTFCVDVQAKASPEPQTLNASPNAPPELDDTLREWFKQQDSILDDILLRLARIETLVSDIHRLISQLPNPIQAAPAPHVAASGALPPKMPSAPAPTASASLAAAAADRAPQLAGGALLLLLLLWLARRRPPKTKTAMAAPAPAVPPAPTFAQASSAKPAPIPSAAPMPSTTMTGQLGDQAIELAEIMLSMGLGHGAAQTLAEQIRSEPKQALRQWLKLLEIYRQNGQQSEFERSAEELRQYFNVQPEDWQARPESYRSIAEYPHIAARLTELWGKPSCLSYLGNLLDDNRGGARAGFPQTVAEELLLLTAMLRGAGIAAEAEAAVDAA